MSSGVDERQRRLGFGRRRPDAAIGARMNGEGAEADDDADGGGDGEHGAVAADPTAVIVGPYLDLVADEGESAEIGGRPVPTDRPVACGADHAGGAWSLPALGPAFQGLHEQRRTPARRGVIRGHRSS